MHEIEFIMASRKGEAFINEPLHIDTKETCWLDFAKNKEKNLATSYSGKDLF